MRNRSPVELLNKHRLSHEPRYSFLYGIDIALGLVSAAKVEKVAPGKQKLIGGKEMHLKGNEFHNKLFYKIWYDEPQISNEKNAHHVI